jgi:hypothetical protein
MERLPSIERNARLLQGVADAAMVAISLCTAASLFLA